MFVAALYTLNENQAEKQKELRPAHFAHSAAAKIRIAVAGPTLAEDGAVSGGLFILETPTIEEARRFCAEDPYTTGGIWRLAEFRVFDKKVG